VSERPMGIVRHDRWLAWGFNHGCVVRPAWLARALVSSWNWVSCHAFGHEWYPEMEWDEPSDDVHASTTQEFCPNCCATRQVSA